MPKLAKSVEVVVGGDVLIDGEPFPWHVARQPVSSELDPDGAIVVYLPIMVDGAVHLDMGGRSDAAELGD